MSINARAAARKEAEMAFLKAEDELLKKLGKKRKREAAERSAAIKEKDLPGYEPEEPIFYSEEDREEENEYSDFGKEFLKELESEEEEYLSYADRRKQKKSDTVFDTYNTGEEWLMSEGEDDLAKGFINNFRSAIGTGVEDFAYWLNDNAPWYEPAETVLKNNTAGKIEEKAQKQFGNAKANGVNGKFVDAMDDLSKGLGYNVFGAKAGNYIQSGAESFDEYRTLRDSGYTKEEETLAMAKKAGLSFVEDKLLDKGGEWLAKYVPKNGSYGAKAEFVASGFEANSNNKVVEKFFDKEKEITDIEYEEILQFKNCEYKINIQNGVSCFPKDDQLYKNIQNVKPIKYENTGEYCFDIGIHGNPKNVAFSSAKDAPIMTPKALAVSISQNTNYKKGQPVRLLSCSTGKGIPFDDCFAQKLANEINAPVVAPTDILWVFDNGRMEIGKHNQGEWKEFVPIYR